MNHRTIIRTVALMVVVGAVALAATAASSSAGTSPRIVNGQSVTAPNYALRWPGIVSLQIRSDGSPPPATQGHFCGGTLIAANLVLTAAHCVVVGPDVAPADFLRVLVGTSDLGGGGTYHNVSEIFPDPQYDETGIGEHDDAVLVLADNVVGVTPMPYVGAGDTALWGNGAGMATGADGPWIGGWGVRWLDPVLSLNAQPVLPADLQEAKVPIVADSECAGGGAAGGVGWGRNFDPATMLCVGELATTVPMVGGTMDGTSACFGDSGGPLIVSDGMAGYKQAGITSFGPFSCTDRFNTGVYTRVDGVRSHIDDVVANNATLPKPVRKTPTSDTRVAGDPAVGETVSCDPGSWSGTSISYTYQWYRVPAGFEDDDPYQDYLDSLTTFQHHVDEHVAGRRYGADDEAAANGLVKLAGKTSRSYTVTSADRTFGLACAVTASNASWSTYWIGYSEPVVDLDASGTASGVRLKTVKAKCSGETCTVIVRLTGHGTGSIVRVGGFAIRGTHSEALDGYSTDDDLRWRVDHRHKSGAWKAYLWGWDAKGRRTHTLVVNYRG